MRALFLDRDGIINEVVMRSGIAGSPRHFSEFKVIADAIELVEWAKKLGYATILITNQPDVSRGKMTRYQLQKMHQSLLKVMPFDKIEVCTSSNDAHFRRKPNPGMLLQSAKRLKINLTDSYFLGDSHKDLEAGKRAGVKTILLQTEYNQKIHGHGDFNCDSYSQILSIIKTESSPCSFKNIYLK